MNHLTQLQAEFGRREARAVYMLVMEKAFGLSATEVLLGKDKELSAHGNAALENITARLLRHEPVQYVLGEADFMGRSFDVGPGVLVPRPETEYMTALVTNENARPRRMLDIGTGSGCIAVSLALAGHEVTATDISPEALRRAEGNARRLGARVRFVQDDILRPALEGMWDAIVSNPPYIRHCEAAEMEPEVILHEPHTALFVPDDRPLLFYEAIASYAAAHLAQDGRIYLECNRAFAADVASMLADRGFGGAEVIADQFGNPRIVKALRGNGGGPCGAEAHAGKTGNPQ